MSEINRYTITDGQKAIRHVTLPVGVEPAVPHVNGHVPLGHIWENEEWVLPSSVAKYQTKDQAIHEMKTWIENVLNQVTSKYPRQEIDSWPTKNEAARAVSLDTARPDQTQIIQNEADKTGKTLNEQVVSILTKADQFGAIIALTSGFRQKIEGQLSAATSSGEYEQILEAGFEEMANEMNAFGLDLDRT